MFIAVYHWKGWFFQFIIDNLTKYILVRIYGSMSINAIVNLFVLMYIIGPIGVAAAAAIASSRKRKHPHHFETNPSKRKRQQTRLL